jgi:hypothetical protein
MPAHQLQHVQTRYCEAGRGFVYYFDFGIGW